MTNLYVYCEGQTEKTFVDDLLSPFLADKGIYAIPIICGDGRSGKKGGIWNYQQVIRELTVLCHEHPNEFVTTMIDYSPPHKLELDYKTEGTVDEQIRSMETAIESSIKANNLIMNFMLHEFEAIFYSSPDAFIEFGSSIPAKVQRIADKSGGPEMINTSADTLPSKRLDSIIPGYTETKTFYTKKLLENMTLDGICSKCDHFREWLKRVIDLCKDSNTINVDA